MTQDSSLVTPEQILKRIFELVNQVREQYNRTPLQFSKELSFLAGEHAINMSTKKVPYGHDGFEDRLKQTPLAISFSENIAELSGSQDPAQSIVVNWLSSSSSFSRILSSFTHTGIGAAESEESKWYCCQIFATIKTKMSKKEQLLLVGRHVNRIRMRRELKPLSFSLTATSRLNQMFVETPESLSFFSSVKAKKLFPECYESEYMMEKVPNSPEFLKNFFKVLKEKSNYYSGIKRESYTDLAFSTKLTSHDQIICILVLAECPNFYRKIPKIDIHFPTAAKCIQLVNDYRLSHSMNELKLCHQWCRFADKYANKMMNREIELDDQKITNILKKFQPNCQLTVAINLIPNSIDPLRELLLVWISSYNSRLRLLSESTHFGFGIAILNQRLCYTIRIIGTNPDDTSEAPSVDVKKDPNTNQYLCITSDANFASPEMSKNVSSTFRLTG